MVIINMIFNNKIVFLILASLLCLLPLRVSQSQNSCIECHQELEGELQQPVIDMKTDDVHASRNLYCDACHGGDATSDDPEISMSPGRGFLGVPSPRQIPDFCGRCHADPQFMRSYSISVATDQLDKYWTSQHGVALKKGDKNVATCSSCHRAHGVYPAKNPRSSVWPVNVPETCNRCHGDAELMKRYRLSPRIYDEYAASVHGMALLGRGDRGSPACNDCHGNHGAVPPGVQAVAQVCRECHINYAEYYMDSPHQPVFAELGLSECIECHNNHLVELPTDEWLGFGEGSNCGQCHAEDEADRGYQVAAAFKAMIDSLRAQYDAATALIHDAEAKGVAVSEAEFALNDIHDALLKSRTLIHTFDEEKVRVTVDEGLSIAATAIQSGQSAQAEFRSRYWFWIISTVLILALILAIYLKIKEIER